MGASGSSPSRGPSIIKSYKEESRICILEGTSHASTVADFRNHFWIPLIVLVNRDPLIVMAIPDLSRATGRKMIQNLARATSHNPPATVPLHQAGFTN
jgi:cation transport ATPase